jgi:photosystem II stability/assembly factor-like uncharacterized protein
MTTKTKQRSSKPRAVKAPQRREEARDRRRAWLLAIATVAGVAVVSGLLATFGGRGSAMTSEGLPRTPDYHSLLVSPNDPQGLVLGTHNGLFRSTDGGRTWASYTLPGQDAMNLVRATGGTVWTAGHLVFAKSEDGGETWTDLRPESLPSLDLHGFAVDPRDPRTLYAAVAGEGLYRSRDAGRTFALVSDEVGGAVFGLAVTPDGRILAGDGRLGLVESRDGGATWREVLRAAIVGLAVSPHDPQRMLATGPGVYLSTDGGSTWRQVLEAGDGVGPVAWSPSAPRTAFAVGFDRTLHKTLDGGETWTVVN